VPAHAKTRHNVVLLGILAFVALAIGVIVVVAPTQKNTTLPGPQQAVNSQVGLVLPLVQLEGQWYVKNDETAFVATVKGQDISIELLGAGDVSAVYWHGTFKSSESSGQTITSTKTVSGDEIVLSQDATKDFVVQQDTLTFKFSALGMTRSVALHR
jgi:hypothetical protein